MTTPRDDVPRQTAAMERVQELAAAHGFDADADAQQALYEALLAYAGEERAALIGALVAEDAALLARWRRDPNMMPDTKKDWYVRGGRDALQRVAQRLGITDLHERAAAVVARGEEP